MRIEHQWRFDPDKGGAAALPFYLSTIHLIDGQADKIGIAVEEGVNISIAERDGEH